MQASLSKGFDTHFVNLQKAHMHPTFYQLMTKTFTDHLALNS